MTYTRQPAIDAPVIPVSVIVPCFRCVTTIERAVASIALQTRRPAEIILVDDSSGDGTARLLHAIRDRHPKGWIRVIEQPSNCGPGSARNAGWNQSTQAYVAFLDADDSWHPQKLEHQYSWMKRNPHVDLSGHACQVNHVDTPAAPFYASADFECTPVSLAQFLFRNRFSTPSVMLKTGLANRFDEKKRCSEDYLLWMEIAATGQCAASRLPLGFLHKKAYGISGLSGDLWAMAKGELDTYRRVAAEGHVSRVALLALYPWSLLKYLRRWILVAIRRQPKSGEAHA